MTLDEYQAEALRTAASSLGTHDLTAAAAELTRGAPVPLTGLRDVLSRIATALALEGVSLSDGLVNAYAVWVVEALAMQ